MEWTKEKADTCIALKEAKGKFFEQFNISNDEEAMITIHDAEVFLAGYDAGAAASKPPAPPAYLFVADFSKTTDGIITNEYAHWNPNDVKSVRSTDWEMTSGSLFAMGGKGWTGIPNDQAVDPLSVKGNNSQDFRLTTRRKDFENVTVRFKYTPRAQVASAKFPARAWDGMHVFLRYQREETLYYASVNRRDKTAIIKKKIIGGPGPLSNGGTYYELTPYVPFAWAPNIEQDVVASISTLANGSVLILLAVNGKEIVRALDDGKLGGPPILSAGAVGIRGDNTQFTFNPFTVEAV